MRKAVDLQQRVQPVLETIIGPCERVQRGLVESGASIFAKPAVAMKLHVTSWRRWAHSAQRAIKAMVFIRQARWQSAEDRRHEEWSW